MLRKTALTLLLMLVLVLALPGAAHADTTTNMPESGCPTGFMLMDVMEHDAMEHTHAGLKVDLNGDGKLCMREATSTIHVHMDNTVVMR